MTVGHKTEFARPMAEVLRDNAQRVIETYAGWSGDGYTTVAERLFGDRSYCHGVLGKRTGKPMGYRVWSYDVIIARFSDVWPDAELPWPAGVPRIWPHQIDDFPSFPKATFGKGAEQATTGEPAPAAAEA